jgi:hypothetical protein
MLSVKSICASRVPAQSLSRLRTHGPRNRDREGAGNNRYQVSRRLWRRDSGRLCRPGVEPVQGARVYESGMGRAFGAWRCWKGFRVDSEQRLLRVPEAILPQLLRERISLTSECEIRDCPGTPANGKGVCEGAFMARRAGKCR